MATDPGLVDAASGGDVSAAWEVGRRAVARAPVRVADVGGWTDTWFGSPGRVCHVAVGPGVEVVAELVRRGPAPVRLVAADIGVDQAVAPGGSRDAPTWATPSPGLHPLLEHAIASIVASAEVPEDLGVDVRIASLVPPGASLGTSGAVVVALLGALDGLLCAEARFPEELAVLAHQVETQRAGREAGVQDQWAAAMGGVGLLAVGPYPEVRHEAIVVPPRAAAELDHRLVTVVFGPHDSSQVHAQVINAMVGCGGAEHDRARQSLRRLAALAGDAAAALADGALDQWAEVLVASTEAQRQLHPALVGPAHQAAIDVARAHGATGWKVNGAGGDGGSLTLVVAPDAVDAVVAALAAFDSGWSTLRLGQSGGLSVGVA
ncbi:MAG: GHMP family kinase ATP-binding protein [Aquihabitans sp.]